MELSLIEEAKMFDANNTGNSVNKQKAGELIASLKKLSPDIKEQKEDNTCSPAPTFIASVPRERNITYRICSFRRNKDINVKMPAIYLKPGHLYIFEKPGKRIVEKAETVA